MMTIGTSQTSRALNVKADPQREIADVEGIANQREWAGFDERTKAIASRARDDADMPHGPEAQRLAARHDCLRQARADAGEDGSAAGMSRSASASGTGSEVRRRNSHAPARSKRGRDSFSSPSQ